MGKNDELIMRITDLIGTILIIVCLVLVLAVDVWLWTVHWVFGAILTAIVCFVLGARLISSRL